MELPYEVSLRLIVAFVLGLTSGLLLAIYFNVYRLWGVFLRFFIKDPKKPPTQHIRPLDIDLSEQTKAKDN